MRVSNITVRDFSDSGVLHDIYLQKQVAVEVPLTPQAPSSVVAFPDGFSVQGCTQVGVGDARYLSICMLNKEGEKEPTF